MYNVSGMSEALQNALAQLNQNTTFAQIKALAASLSADLPAGVMAIFFAGNIGDDYSGDMAQDLAAALAARAGGSGGNRCKLSGACRGLISPPHGCKGGHAR